MKKTFLTWTIAALLGAAVAVVFFWKAPDQQTTDVKQPAVPRPPSDAKINTDIHIYATAWGMTLAENGTGFYNDLANLYLTGLETSVNYDIRPYRRAKALFFRDKASCLYPSNIELLREGGEISSADGFIDTVGFLQVKVYVFSPPGTTPPAKIDDVAHQSVAYAMGSRIPYFLRNTKADFIAVANESDKAKMLLTGRVDLMTAAMPDAKFVFDAMGVPLPPFDPSYELNNTPVRMTCHDTPENRSFADAFNQHAQALVQSGEVQKLFEIHRLDPKLYLPSITP